MDEARSIEDSDHKQCVIGATHESIVRFKTK